MALSQVILEYAFLYRLTQWAPNELKNKIVFNEVKLYNPCFWMIWLFLKKKKKKRKKEKRERERKQDY